MKISILSTKNVREKKLANKRHKITRRKEQKKLKKIHETADKKTQACIPYETRKIENNKGCSDKHKKFKNVRSKDT
jgi:GTP-binding protein EngB required for normal cell division